MVEAILPIKNQTSSFYEKPIMQVVLIG